LVHVHTHEVEGDSTENARGSCMLVPINRGWRSIAIWVGYSLLAAAIFSFGIVAVTLIKAGKLSVLPGIVRTVVP
jgi:hypothetical protein